MWLAGTQFPKQGLNLALKAQSSNHWVARKAPGNAAAISRGAAQMLPNTLQCTVPQQGATGPRMLKDAECGAVVKVNVSHTSLIHAENTRTSADATDLRFKEPTVIPDQVFLLLRMAPWIK